MRRRLRIVIPAVLALVLAAVAAVYVWQRPLLLTGTGYAAHNACALATIADRDHPEDDLPPNPLVPYLRSAGSGDPTTASLLGVGARQRAWASPGFGCTLTKERPELGTASPISPSANPLATATAPTPDANLAHALAAAFGDDLPTARKAALGTRAVVVVKEGHLLAERYADGFDASTPQLGWSMSKSVAALLTGVLVQRGTIALDDDHLRPEWTDERAGITVEQLLRMTSGLRWDETYELGTPITRMLYLEPDMGRYVASLPATAKPGTVQQYSSGSTTLLCSVLSARTGEGADLPRRALLGPLGLSSAVWEPDAAGTPVCSSYLWMTPRDWAAIGQFALQDGRWNGRQLLPADWMKRSLDVRPVTRTDDPGYGMGWRTNRLPDGTLRWPALPEDTYYASGHDGQKVVVVPSQELVVVRMGFTPEADDEPSETRLVQDVIAATQ